METPFQFLPEEPMYGWWVFLSTAKEVGKALDVLPEATGKEEVADSPIAASWNCKAGLANEVFFQGDPELLQHSCSIPIRLSSKSNWKVTQTTPS